MTLPLSAREQYRLQQGISSTTTAAVAQAWRGMGDEFDASWERVGPTLVNVVELGRRAAVANAVGYTSKVLAETGQIDDAVGALNPAVFLSTAPDGRPVDTLLGEAVVGAKVSVGRGLSAEDALAQSGRWLEMTTLTLLADTRREVYGADIIQRPALAGYARMLNPPSCSRCIVLAGKWFRWNAGFERHPRCDCQHVPASEAIAGDMTVDPYAMFRSMTPEAQEKAFGRIEARAIRDGADIYRVVNINQRGLATARGARLYGTPSRLTVDDIYRQAGTRTNAIRMMRENGYITGEQVAGGNIRGNGPAAAGFGQLGRGGTRRAASNAVLDAASTGERNPLNRYTMTAAERRLYDANYRLQYARRTGRVPRSIGASSADTSANPIIATPARLAELERALARQIAILNRPGTPDSVRRVARALGLL
ncbi:hypothetical protein Q9R08_05160 [Microbacterium sp. QXD-8]|uniref:Capsid maturation protease n=1 Tax=Microbacterium psychrotolerans TaxID=3068321 RepID=A0ABU0YYF3_9MICO|nr:hypothetical protein [Microbacterium sp. QXD-8]MDQ7877362.1 hypothetical protein [Microbacterium sp. QXD-8]